MSKKDNSVDSCDNLPDETIGLQNLSDLKTNGNDTFQVAHNDNETAAGSDDSLSVPKATQDAAAPDLTAGIPWSGASNYGFSSSETSVFDNSPASLSEETSFQSEMPQPDPQLLQEEHLLSHEPTPGFILLGMPIVGGMGCVYKAWNIQLERVVALKLSKKDHSVGASPAAAQELDAQLRNEAALLARLEHPSIASCYGCGRFGQYSYFEMQWIDGITLDKLITFVHQNDLQEGLGEAQLIPWMIEMVEALVFSQLRGVHHLDLKPQNIMLTANSPENAGLMLPNNNEAPDAAIAPVDQLKKWCQAQTVKLLDFGLAKRTSQSTFGAMLSGTPGYMAPEQILDKRWLPSLVDMYCVGGILYACLTGKSPNRPSTKVIRNAFQTKDLSAYCDRPNIREVNPSASKDLEAIALKCLASKPDQRYAQMDDLRSDLLSIKAHKPLIARPFSMTERLVKYVKRHPYSVSMIALLTIGLGTMALLSSWLLQAYNETELARKSDQKTFQQAIEAVATMDQQFLTDPQLNQPENRELAIRFKATLFELYQLFTTREHLKLVDRRRLAEISSRLANDQLKRGDYSLAVDFYQITLEQYKLLAQLDSKQEADSRELLLTRIVLCWAKAQLPRERFPAEAIISEAKSIIAQCEATDDVEIELVARANFARLTLTLYDREGVRGILDELDTAYLVSTQFEPQSNGQRLAKAKALQSIGLVGYKGQWPQFRTCVDQSIAIYERLLEESTHVDTELFVNHASGISNLGMILYTGITAKAREIRAQSDTQTRLAMKADFEERKKELEQLHLGSLARLDQALDDDPLNSLILRRRISCYWNLADFYRGNFIDAADRDFEAEVKYRQLCIADARRLIEQQPQYQKGYTALSVNLIRLGHCFHIMGRAEEASGSFRQFIAIDSWFDLYDCTIDDSLCLIFDICEKSTDEVTAIPPARELSAALDRISALIDQVESMLNTECRLQVPLTINIGSLTSLGPEYQTCREKIRILGTLVTSLTVVDD